MSNDEESHWIHRLHSVWSIRVSSKIRVFFWIVTYQCLPKKTSLGKNDCSNDPCMAYQKVENVKHIFWECSFAWSCWEKIQSLLENVLQEHLH